MLVVRMTDQNTIGRKRSAFQAAHQGEREGHQKDDRADGVAEIQWRHRDEVRCRLAQRCGHDLVAKNIAPTSGNLLTATSRADASMLALIRHRSVDSLVADRRPRPRDHRSPPGALAPA